MTFFPEVTPPDDDSSEHHVAPEWAAPPVDWLPSRIGVSTVLATTDDIAVTVTGLSVHAAGLQIDVRWLLRNRQQNRRDWSTLMDRFGGGRWGNGAVDPARSIRFGVVLDDGTKVVADVDDAFHDDPAKVAVAPTAARAARARLELAGIRCLRGTAHVRRSRLLSRSPPGSTHLEQRRLLAHRPTIVCWADASCQLTGGR
jgi:hypothetical protein